MELSQRIYELMKFLMQGFLVFFKNHRINALFEFLSGYLL